MDAEAAYGAYYPTDEYSDSEGEEDEDAAEDDDEASSSSCGIPSGYSSTGGKRPARSFSEAEADKAEESAAARSTTGGKGPMRPTTGGKGLKRPQGTEPPSPKRHSPDMRHSNSSPAFPLAEPYDSVASLRTDLDSQRQLTEQNAAQLATVSAELAALKQSIELQQRLTPAAPDIHAWDSEAAKQSRPSPAQIDTIINYAVEGARSQATLESISAITCMTRGQSAQFLEGRLTLHFHDPGFLSKTLWQLWSFVVEGRAVSECVPETCDGENEIHLFYGETAATTAHGAGIYFATRAMAPPPPRDAARSAGRYSAMSVSGAASSSGLTPLFGSTSFLGSSPAPPPRLMPPPMSPSIDIGRDLGKRIATFAATFGRQPPASYIEAGREYLTVFAQRRVAIEAADKHEASERLRGHTFASRGSGSMHPEWSLDMERADPVTGRSELLCGDCGEPGILTGCAGCGKKFHFDCCDDKQSPPPASNVAWYCGHTPCPGSAWRSICGFKPNAVTPTTFRCCVCLEDLNDGLKAKLVGCRPECAHTCTGCAHQLIFTRDETDFVSCAACRSECKAILRPGSETPEQIVFMPYEEGGGSLDDESVQVTVRRRRGSLTEAHNRDIEQQQLERARIASVYEAAESGSMQGSQLVAALAEAQAGPDRDASDLLGTDAEPLDDGDVAAAAARARGNTRVRSTTSTGAEARAARSGTSPSADVDAPGLSPSEEGGEQAPPLVTAPKPAKDSKAAKPPPKAPRPPSSMSVASSKKTAHLSIDPAAIRAAAASKGKKGKKSKKSIYSDDEADGDSEES